MTVKLTLGLPDARNLTLGQITPLESIRKSLLQGVGHTLAKDIYSSVDSPSVNCSMRDGYAVVSKDTENAPPTIPVQPAAELTSNHSDWTQFIYGTLQENIGIPLFKPIIQSSRLDAMANPHFSPTKFTTDVRPRA